jgi:hypothetical protein
VRKNLRDYCGLDTYAMVMLVYVLRVKLGEEDEDGGERVAV